MTHLVVVTMDAIRIGRQAFFDYQRYLACGPASQTYEAGRFRTTGPEMIVGAIYACIERHFSTREEIVAAVSKFTLCRSWTVAHVLDELTGAGREGYPFSLNGELYQANGYPTC